MILIPIFQTLAFAAYVWYIVAKFNILPSISASWYAEESTHTKWMFILFVIVGLALPTLILGILTKNIWFDAAAVSLGIIAAAPAFRDKHKIVGILHTGGTVAGIAFACYALVTHGIYFSVIGCAVVSTVLARLKVPNTTLWQELGDFFFIELGVYQLITLHL